MYPTVTSFRPSSGMRCDSRLLSSFITGALTATTVTLFLLRVVPGTYVVLPCDPTITLRPVSMEEYMDHMDKQQEVFPDDIVIDTRPIHIPAVVESAASHRKKSLHPEKHRNQKKGKSQREHNKKHQEQQQKHDSTLSGVSASGEPRDLQHQLKKLQEKEEKENGLQATVLSRPAEQKQHLKSKWQQEQRQVKQHLKEIQLHLQQQAEEMKQHQQDERDRKVREQRQRLQNLQKHSQPNVQQKQTLTRQKHLEDKLQSANKINSVTQVNEIPRRAKRESNTPKHEAARGKDDRRGAHQRPPDSILLQAIMARQGDPKAKQSRAGLLQTSVYFPSLAHQVKVDKSKSATSNQVWSDAKDDHKVTDITVPKLSRIVPWNVKVSHPLP